MMATKPKKKIGQIPERDEAETLPRKAVPLYTKPGETDKQTYRNLARLMTSPELAAYRVINGAENKSGIGEHIDVPSLLAQLRDEAGAVNGGDLARVEAMLANQATALQSLFSRLAERGMSCDQVPGFEVNMRIALRAQSQCRATLETLAAIKNPPIIYARQANVTTGPQQINNGEPSRTGEKSLQSNKLLGVDDGKRMDTGAAGAASSANSGLEALGVVNGAAKPQG